MKSLSCDNSFVCDKICLQWDKKSTTWPDWLRPSSDPVKSLCVWVWQTAFNCWRWKHALRLFWLWNCLDCSASKIVTRFLRLKATCFDFWLHWPNSILANRSTRWFLGRRCYSIGGLFRSPHLICLSVCLVMYCGQTMQDRPIVRIEVE